MNFEIVEEPIRFNLKGISSIVENERYGEVGLRLMNERCSPAPDKSLGQSKTVTQAMETVPLEQLWTRIPTLQQGDRLRDRPIHFVEDFHVWSVQLDRLICCQGTWLINLP